LLVIIGLLDRRKRKSLVVPDELPGITISFKNVSYMIKEKSIIDSISGEVKPGEVLAVMGPSGSGKSTFLDILAQKRKGGVVSGVIKLNDMDWIDPVVFRKLSGYVDQDDYHTSCLTVREVLLFSANLRLPEGMSDAKKNERVDMVLDQLGLTHIQNSRIGDHIKRGISGGEKRRLSIGVELVTNPSVLFLDEPTSGLDSYNALQVIQTLSKLAVGSDKTVLLINLRSFLPSINPIPVYLQCLTKYCYYRAEVCLFLDLHKKPKTIVLKMDFHVLRNITSLIIYLTLHHRINSTLEILPPRKLLK
jgi:ABC-type cobalamin/Fe3+-siderophores transport system ATPase subunit